MNGGLEKVVEQLLVSGNERHRIGLRSFVDLCHGCCLNKGPLTICSAARLVAMHMRLNTTVLFSASRLVPQKLSALKPLCCPYPTLFRSCDWRMRA